MHPLHSVIHRVIHPVMHPRHPAGSAQALLAPLLDAPVPGSIALGGCALLAAVTVPLIRSDLRYRRLPNRLLAPVALWLALGTLLTLWAAPRIAAQLLLGAAVWGVPLLLAALCGGLGMGDVKLGGLLGAQLALLAGVLFPAQPAGWWLPVAGFALSALCSGVAGLRALGGRAGGRREPIGDPRHPPPSIALGPLLLLGYWVCVALVGVVAYRCGG